MFVEREFHSDVLSKRARDFVTWSASAGETLRKMYLTSGKRALKTASTSPEFSAFPQNAEILHVDDYIHYPAVRFARERSRAATYIQSFTLIHADPKRYAYIIQGNTSGNAASVAITRELPLVPSGISMRFGRLLELPNSFGVNGSGLIDIDLNGNARAVAEKEWNKARLVSWVDSLFQHITHGINLNRVTQIQALCDLGFHHNRWHRDTGVSLSAEFSEPVSVLE